MIEIDPTNLHKIVLGDDLELQCQAVFNDDPVTYPDLENSTLYVTIKRKADSEAVFAVNSTDDADKFLITDNETAEFTILISTDDEDCDIEYGVKYKIDCLIVLPDGKRKRFIYDTIEFEAPIT